MTLSSGESSNFFLIFLRIISVVKDIEEKYNFISFDAELNDNHTFQHFWCGAVPFNWQLLLCINWGDDFLNVEGSSDSFEWTQIKCPVSNSLNCYLFLSTFLGIIHKWCDMKKGNYLSPSLTLITIPSLCFYGLSQMYLRPPPLN